MIELPPLPAPALVDTGTWTWVRDRRHPYLADWFNREAAAGRVLVCDVVVLELVRMAPNQQRAEALNTTLSAFESVTMPPDVWADARRLQIALAATGDHRRVSPTDLLISCAAMRSGVSVLHYDHDYERIAAVSELQHRWLQPPGTLA